MVGAYLAYYTSMVWFTKDSSHPFTVWLAQHPIVLLLVMLVIAMVGTAALGVTIERLAYRPLRKAPRLSVLITAVGISLFMEYAGRLIVQTSPQPSIVEEINPFAKSTVNFLGIQATTFSLIVMGVVAFLMVTLWFIVTKTPTGRAMRAVSHDFQTASLMGINVDKIIVFTFVLGSALAGAGGMLQATNYGTPLNTFFGVLPGVKAFVAAVLGGIGNIPGAVAGGLIMGVSEYLVVWLGYAGYKDAVAFLLLIIILLVKPSGLFGSVRDKV